jgi:sugar O-acyltransferase (sialic acid O-acetyltransferase NeuD family)
MPKPAAAMPRFGDENGVFEVKGQILFGLFGTGGFARPVMPLARYSLNRALGTANNAGPPLVLVFVDRHPDQTSLNGYPVMSEEEFFAAPAARKYFNVAIAASELRQRLTETCVARGLEPLSLQAANTIVYDDNSIAEGAVLCSNTIVTCNTRIGKFFHLNIFSYVEHDCVIGDYVTFAPGVRCNGNVHIGNHAFIGAGAILRDGTKEKPLVIGANATVGMGAVVTRSVAAGETVVGNPARPLRKST